MSAESVLRGEYTETVRRLDEKIDSLGDDMKDLKQEVAQHHQKTQADIQELTRTINRWGGAIAVIVVIALLVLGRLIQLVGF